MANAPLQGMRFLSKILLIGTLFSTVAGCYVQERRGPRYAHRYECARGWHWDGYHCRHRGW
jgi:hypothetical protein